MVTPPTSSPPPPKRARRNAPTPPTIIGETLQITLPPRLPPVMEQVLTQMVAAMERELARIRGEQTSHRSQMQRDDNETHEHLRYLTDLTNYHGERIEGMNTQLTITAGRVRRMQEEAAPAAAAVAAPVAAPVEEDPEEEPEEEEPMDAPEGHDSISHIMSANSATNSP